MSTKNKNAYNHWTEITLRYGDTDALGHINNVVYARLLEAGRVEVLFDGVQSLAGPGKTFVIVHISIDFTAEMHFPGTARVGTALVAFGTSSVKLKQAVFKENTCCATAESTLVLIDEISRKPIPLTPEMKAKIQERTAGAASSKL